jgi:Putative peptidoglycan binding domain
MSEKLCSLSQENPKRNPLSESQILASMDWLTNLPKFVDSESFEASDFFLQNYFISSKNLSYDSVTHFESLHFLAPAEYYTSVQSLQRMLIFLWYLWEDDLVWKTLYDESESSVSYFGIFWPKTRRALQDFQRDFCTEKNGVLTPETKQKLFLQIFQQFHQISTSEALVALKEGIGD